MVKRKNYYFNTRTKRFHNRNSHRIIKTPKGYKNRVYRKGRFVLKEHKEKPSYREGKVLTQDVTYTDKKYNERFAKKWVKDNYKYAHRFNCICKISKTSPKGKVKKGSVIFHTIVVYGNKDKINYKKAIKKHDDYFLSHNLKSISYQYTSKRGY